MPRRYKDIADTIETHWSLYSALRDNAGWIVTALGLGGVGSWWTWVWATAAQAPWYEKALGALFAGLFGAFLVTGIRAFLAWHRRSAREEGAIAAGLAWSGHAYARGSIIEGGTHRLAEIFGPDQLRTNLTFRNCQITGPGAVAYYSCNTERSEYFGLPAVQFIDPRYSGEITHVVYQFIRCRFDNCTFSNMLHIQRFPTDMDDSQVYRLVRSSFTEPEWHSVAPDPRRLIPAIPGERR